VKTFYSLVTLICLFLAGIAGYYIAVGMEKTATIKHLQAKFDLILSEKANQSNLLKKVKQNNKELADELKKAKVKVNSLTYLNIQYKKQIVKIKSSKVKTTTPTTQEVTFSKTFNFGTLSGSFKAEKIVNPQYFEFVFDKLPEQVTIVDTEAGIKAYTNNQSNIEVKSLKASRSFLDDFSFVAGVELNKSITPSVLAGIEYKKIILYGRFGVDPAVGIMKRWEF